ncbi:uncharacterized protein BDR25DRAFT_352628 [Lindgomyces ingoldianus]|uniref:Uncharacterized protein n=1 Tax=Lindgomyces ingoldianus TaxID=673940 RepID=A0ACB6R2Y2_9PLEO|nr:uncharacterized protein BDR25DRAFT_352628 [Lindgomyces ingoldianus]KAF2473183.1 hypothetical protein BDR25DRAFT_352628 [Lindgomyces ingoldianus]
MEHEENISETTLLVFLELERMSEEPKEKAMKRFGHSASDYFERQAQAKFQSQNLDFEFRNAPRKELASKYSDPNHPASSLVFITSDGKLNPVGATRQRRENYSPLRYMLTRDALYLMVSMSGLAELIAIDGSLVDHIVLFIMPARIQHSTSLSLSQPKLSCFHSPSSSIRVEVQYQGLQYQL